MKRLLRGIPGLALTYILIGALLDIKRDGGLDRVELAPEPRAPGTPEHTHASFAEDFIAAEGTLSLLVNGEKRLLRAGESLPVTPGTRHEPFNETDSRVVVRGPLTPEYSMPERFLVFLTQAYGFFDESESNRRPPKALLQMSRFSPGTTCGSPARRSFYRRPRSS